jgi:hypothetical protein
MVDYKPTRIEEPFEAWRCILADGRTARATVVPQGGVVLVIWFVDERFEGGETHPSWSTAVTRAGVIRQLLMTRAETAGQDSSATVPLRHRTRGSIGI